MCTLKKRGNVFVLTLTGDGEHRLSLALIESIKAALSRVRSDATPGAALVTTAEGRFFSNGFDLNWATAAGSGFMDRVQLMVDRFEQIVADLFSLPMPTIAAVSGHAAAAGFMLAISHDYVLMRKDRGYLYMSELDIGLQIPDYFMALMLSKIAAPRARRNVELRAEKLTAARAVEEGIIDAAHDGAGETVEAAMRLGEDLAGRKWKGEVYAGIRKGTFPEVCEVLGLVEEKKATATASRL